MAATQIWTHQKQGGSLLFLRIFGKPAFLLMFLLFLTFIPPLIYLADQLAAAEDFTARIDTLEPHIMTKSDDHLVTVRGSGLDQVARVILTQSLPSIRNVGPDEDDLPKYFTRDIKTFDMRFPYLYAIANYSDGKSSYSKVLIIDVSDPNNLKLKKTFQYPGFSNSLQDIKVSDDYLLITDFEKGLWVFDISNPLLPKQKILLPDPSAYGIYVGDYVSDNDKQGVLAGDKSRLLYLTNWKSGLKIYKWFITTARFVLLSSSPIISPYNLDVQIHPSTHECYIYIANGKSAKIISQSSGAVINSIDVNRLLGQNDSSYPPNIVDVKIKDSRYAYIVDSSFGLYVIDVNIPEQPAIVGRLPLPSGRKSITFWENLALVAAGSSGIDLIDISKPSNPVLRHNVSTQGNANFIKVEDGKEAYALIANGNNGLALLSLQLLLPKASGGHLFMEGDIWDITIAADYAYISAGEKGLKVINLKDPWLPRLEYSLDKANTGWDQVKVSKCCVQKNNLYLANGSNLCLFSLSPDYSLASLRETIRRDDAIQSLSLQGDYLYLLSLVKGLQIFQITPCLSRSPSGAVRVGSMPQEVTVQGNLAYVAGGSEGLWIIDVTNPAKPQKISQKSFSPALVLDVEVKGDYAYLVNGSYGISVVKVAEKNNLVIIGSLVEEFQYDYLQDCAIGGDFLYAAGQSNGIWVMDISRPSSPVVLYNIAVMNGANFIFVDQNYIYAANKFGGFDIYLVPKALPIERPCQAAEGSFQDPNCLRFRLPLSDLPAGWYDLIFLDVEGKIIRKYQALQFEEQAYVELRAGLNLFGYPGKVPDENSTSWQLLNSFAGAAYSLWQESSRQVSYWLPHNSSSGDMFEIRDGQAYLLYAREDSPPVSLSADYFYPFEAALSRIGSKLTEGVNWISFPIEEQPTEDKEAFSFRVFDQFSGFAADGHKLVGIDRLNTWSGKWESAYGFYNRCSGRNFPIRRAEGYRVFRY
ncbi:MAG: hypothetical protein K6U11_14300 [bacterium]|nr:hypothetical protein [bacterium]